MEIKRHFTKNTNTRILIVMLLIIALCSACSFVSQGADIVSFLTGGEGRIEGNGYNTKEDAARAYIEGLIEQNVSKMLSACAVETYVNNYDLERHIDRINSLPPISGNGYLPANGPFAYQINLENRRSSLADLIRYQYLAMTKSKVQPGEIVQLQDYSSASELVSDMFGQADLEISLVGDILPGYLFSPLMLSPNGQWGAASTAFADHADRIDAVGALLRINGEIFLLTLGTECYDGQWYVTAYNPLQIMMGMEAYSGGLAQMDVSVSDEEITETLEGIRNDKHINEVFQKVENALSSLDLEEIFAVSDELSQIRSYYEETFNKTIKEYLSEEDLEYLDAIIEGTQ